MENTSSSQIEWKEQNKKQQFLLSVDCTINNFFSFNKFKMCVTDWKIIHIFFSFSMESVVLLGQINYRI